MTYTKEQNQAFTDYLTKQGKTTANATKEDATAFMNTQNTTPPAPSKTDLETKMKSGNYSASDVRAYNQLVGDNNGSRNLLLTSPEAVTSGNLKTNITSDEATMMKNAGITKINKNIGITPEEKAKYQANQNITPTTGTEPINDTPVVTRTPPAPATTTTATINNTEVPTTDLSKIQTVDDWKKQTGGGLNNLESWIEARYGTTAIQENGKIKASIGDKAYEWGLDNAGNPIKTEVKQPTTKDDLVNTMLMGGEVNKNDPNRTKAIDSYNKISNLINATGRQILENINAGIISETDPEFIKLGQLNPIGIKEYTVYKENQRLADQINNSSKNQYTSLSSVNSYDGSKSVGSQTREPTTVMDFLQILSDKVSKNTPPDILGLTKEKISENPEVIKLSNQLSDYSLQIQQLEQQKIEIEDTIKAELKGSGATADYIDAKIRVRTNEISKEENNIILLANNTQSKLTTLTNNAKDEITAMQQQYAMEQQQYQNQLDIAKMGMAEAIRLDERAYQEGQIKEQRDYEAKQKEEELKQQFDYTYGDINSDDPQVQRTAFIKMAEFYQNQYKGMPFRRDIQTMANDMMNEFNSGKSIDEITNQLTTDIQNSPYYEQWKATVGLTPQQQNYGFSNMGGGVIAVTDPNTGNVSFQSQGGTIANDTMQKQEGEVGGDCGTFARQYVGIEGGLNNVVGSTINERKTKFTDEDPKVGGLALFTDGYNKTYGHIAVVESINNDGTINIVESNLKEDGKVSRRTVNQNQVYGFYNNTPLANGQGQTSQGLNAYNDKVFSSYDGKDIKKLADNLGISVEQAKSEYNQWLEGNDLTSQDTFILGEFLKELSGTAVTSEERRKYEKEYIEMKNKGYTTQQIKNQLALYGPYEGNENNQEIMTQLESLQKYVPKIGVKGAGTIASLINQGDFNGAITELENGLYEQKKIDKNGIIDAGIVLKNGDQLKELIKQYEGKFGIITGWTKKQLTKFMEDTEAQRLMSDMANFVAKYRNGIAGTAITKNETSFLQPLTAEITNNPKNAITKIESIQRSLFNGLNVTRDNIGLPKLKSYDNTYDIETRKQLYKQEPTQKTTQTPIQKNNTNYTPIGTNYLDILNNKETELFDNLY